VRIAIFGADPVTRERHGCGLWPAGISASITAAEAVPVPLGESVDRPWAEVLEGVQGLVIAGHDSTSRRPNMDADALCQWCRENQFPVLAIDHGLHALNTAFGGTVHFDLPRDLPDALQHRHPPERGLRHAINVLPETLLADLYGEGEVVVNSEHRRAIQRLARGFRLAAQALDGVIEAIEFNGEWFALGIQWNPSSATASGLDIQLFRGLIDACNRRWSEPSETPAEAACPAA
jgi:putative glutamine amidotransferase